MAAGTEKTHKNMGSDKRLNDSPGISEKPGLDRPGINDEAAAHIESPHPACPSEPHFPDGGFTAWSQVAAGFLLMFNSWGLINSFGVFQSTYEALDPPLANPSQISWIGSVQTFCVLFIGVFAAPFFDAGYVRGLVFAGSFLLVFGLFATSISSTTSANISDNGSLVYWQTFLAQGVCTGIGMGLTFLPSVAIPATYFKRQRTFTVGIAMSGSSVGGIIYPVILRALLPQTGLRWAIRIVAFIALSTGGVASLMMRQRRNFHKKRPTLIDTAAWKDRTFATLLGGLFCGFVGVYVPYFYLESKVIAENIDLKGLQSYWLVSFFSVGGFFGRIVPNYLADRLGPLNIHCICVIIGGILIFVWPFARSLGSLVAFTIVYGFFSGAFISLPPASVASLTSDLTQLGGKLGLVFTINSFAVLIGAPLAGAVLGNGQYTNVAVFAGTVTTVGGLLIALARLFRGGTDLAVKV